MATRYSRASRRTSRMSGRRKARTTRKNVTKKSAWGKTRRWSKATKRTATSRKRRVNRARKLRLVGTKATRRTSTARRSYRKAA